MGTKLNKLVFVSLLIVSAFLIVTSSVSAQTKKVETQVNSYELFWPVVAGKVRGDSMYNLKRFKENARAYLIFGNAQKSDYYVFILVKRVVEAEKLLQAGKVDLAKETIKEAEDLTVKAEGALVQAKEKGESFGQNGPEMVKRLTNIEKLIAWLSAKDEKNKDLFKGLSAKISSLKAKL